MNVQLFSVLTSNSSFTFTILLFCFANDLYTNIERFQLFDMNINRNNKKPKINLNFISLYLFDLFVVCNKTKTKKKKRDETIGSLAWFLNEAALEYVMDLFTKCGCEICAHLPIPNSQPLKLIKTCIHRMGQQENELYRALQFTTNNFLITIWKTKKNCYCVSISQSQEQFCYSMADSLNQILFTIFFFLFLIK